MSFRVSGARWMSVAAGIKKSSDRDNPLDVALLALDAGTTVSAVFTQNAFCAAPVVVARDHLECLNTEKGNSLPRYCLINAGNANAGTGDAGVEAAKLSCEYLAQRLSCEPQQILPFSTGVIGEPLPVDKIQSVANELVEGLNEEGWGDAAKAIMTTDTRPKLVTKEIQIGANTVSIAGIAKGAGMIKPNMATMLSYIVCDGTVGKEDLDDALSHAVNQSFNRITVDGDTSTNDACVLAATGCSGVEISRQSPGWSEFLQALNALMNELATAIIRDAEGASKFITIHVSGGNSSEECLSVGYAVAESPLVKTAFFASDANWGRILAAVGRSGITDFAIDRVRILLGGLCLCENGGRSASYNEKLAMQIMAKPEIEVTIDLGRGEAEETLWTSDLSHDYVRINAEYRT